MLRSRFPVRPQEFLLAPPVSDPHVSRQRCPTCMNWFSIVLRSALSLLILGAGVGAFIWLGEPEVAKQEPMPERPVAAQTIPAEQHEGGIEFEVDGVVVPFRQVSIAAQVPGKVVFKSPDCQTGRIVEKGDVLLRIDPADYDLEVKRLTEELAQADAMIAELDAEILTADNQISLSRQQLDLDTKSLTRNLDLRRRNAGSEAEVDSAKRAVLTTKNSLQSQIDQKNLLTQRRKRMLSNKALGQANLEKAQLALARTTITAPLSGVVVSENVEQDGYVQTGTEVIVLQDTSRVDVSCKLHMRQMNWLWQAAHSQTDSSSSPGTPSTEDFSIESTGSQGYDFPETPATVVYELGDERFEWPAVVDRFDGSGVDSLTRMVPCRVHVSDPNSLETPSNSQSTDEALQGRSAPTLLTGMFVKVRIKTNPSRSLIRLPQLAIQPGNTVWTVDKGMLKKKPVVIASSLDDHAIVFAEPDGLNVNDRVVVSPMAAPMEGMKVIPPGQGPPKQKGGGKPWQQ